MYAIPWRLGSQEAPLQTATMPKGNIEKVKLQFSVWFAGNSDTCDVDPKDFINGNPDPCQ